MTIIMTICRQLVDALIKLPKEIYDNINYSIMCSIMENLRLCECLALTERAFPLTNYFAK